MAVAASDLKWKLSINTGAGNSTAQTNLADSTGGFMASTEFNDSSLHNLFDAVTGEENAASTVEYRCIFIHNSNAADSLTNAVVWLPSVYAGGADLAIAKDGTGAVAYNSASAQAEREANTTTAPTGETFSAPSSKASGISIGTLGANQCVAIWLRRTATDSAALSPDGGSIRIEGDVA